ncbi:MAG: 2TM domain-containing protein [Dehalococcoidales bacterium]|nr:2TM domain-containing protein [Dehalococcoidales bacterium]
MKNGMSEEQIYELARKRVKARKDFFIHLSAYVVVNAMLIGIWWFTSKGGYPWFVWCLGGWGIGIIFHFLDVIVFGNRSETNAINKEVERIKQEQDQS